MYVCVCEPGFCVCVCVSYACIHIDIIESISHAPCDSAARVSGGLPGRRRPALRGSAATECVCV